MTSQNSNYFTRLHHLCECPECVELQSQQAKNNITHQLNKLSKIKAKPDFDRKMAAVFAMELEEEVGRKNRSWLRKNKKIRLPSLITNLSQEFN